MKTTIDTITKIIGMPPFLPGVVWFLQGINISPGSIMSGNPRWVVNGLIAMIVDAGLFWPGNRK